MNKTQSIIIILTCIGFSTIASGQDKSRSILDEVSTQLLAYTTLQADFSFSLINEEADISDTFEGNLVMQGEKFRLSVMGVLALCDGNSLWNYSAELNEATILDPEESDFFNPINIFTLYQQDFELKTINSKGSVHTIELLPKTKNEEYTRIIIIVDNAKKLIRDVTYFGSDGNKYVIHISNVIPNIQIDDRFFIFDTSKHPGVTVYDMR
ncbi:MAG: outer membrane lipoprotein carrier protein LolA [Bacteroidales bacterium]|nr:outer membrane lipoprotein carrier protein LolA [Bacteroidales bacterium]